MQMDHMGVHTAEQFRFPMPASTETLMSEFNHHLAGAVVILLLGISAILLYIRPRQFGFLKYIWPSSLLALGLYLVFYSDPPSWPSGYISFSKSMSDPETMQHKVYALLLMVMGVVELTRAAGIAKADYWKYAFPVFAGFGALYLIAHKHSVGHEHEMMNMSAHNLVFYQHIAYIVIGMAAVISKVLYDTHKLRGRYAPYIWPSFIVLLGILLVLYTE